MPRRRANSSASAPVTTPSSEEASTSSAADDSRASMTESSDAQPSMTMSPDTRDVLQQLTDVITQGFRHQQRTVPFAELPKFSGRDVDYIPWRDTMILALRDRGIDMNNPADIRAHDEEIRRAILQNIDEINRLEYSDPLMNGGRIWQSMEDRFRQPDPIVIRSIRMRLSECRIGHNADEYLARIQGFVSMLKERREIITERDHVEFILHGLNSAYHEVETAWYTPSIPSSLKDVRAHVRSVCSRMKLRQASAGINLVAAKHRNDRTPRRPKLCPRCQQHGHSVDHCTLPCNHCGLTGHSQNRCPQFSRSD